LFISSGSEKKTQPIEPTAHSQNLGIRIHDLLIAFKFALGLGRPGLFAGACFQGARSPAW